MGLPKQCRRVKVTTDNGLPLHTPEFTVELGPFCFRTVVNTTSSQHGLVITPFAVISIDWVLWEIAYRFGAFHVPLRRTFDMNLEVR